MNSPFMADRARELLERPDVAAQDSTRAKVARLYELDFQREANSEELELAEKLIATLNTTWKPEAYADTYRRELLERIAQKEPAQIPEERTAAPSGSQVEALMDALKASVEQAKKKQPKRSSRKRTA
jgi:non-homologous end joining protein Ku